MNDREQAEQFVKDLDAVVAERVHHPYSPSTLQNLEACPAWEGTQSAVPHPRTVIGTISHGVTETGEDDHRLSDEDADKVAECIDFYESRKQVFDEYRRTAVVSLTAQLWGARVLPGDSADAGKTAEDRTPPVRELKETYLPVDDKKFDDGVVATTAGYVDSSLISYDERYAEMFDWKFGFWAVEPTDNNLQAMAYVLGLFRKFPKLEKVRFFFKQPNIEYISQAEFTRATVAEIYLRIQVVVAKAREARKLGDFSTASPHVPACNFCKHLADCPKVSELVCKVGSKFYPVEIPSDINHSVIHNPEDTTIGLRLAQVVSVWAKAFKRSIQERVIRGDAKAPIGFMLQDRTPREIIDEGKYKQVALAHMTEDEYASTLKPSLGKVETIISDKAVRGQKKATVEKFDEQARAAGAIVDGEGYVFLRAVPSKPTE